MGVKEITDTIAGIDWLRQHLKDEEGWRNRAYRDTEGFWTIGCGHKLPADLPLETIQALDWTDEQIAMALELDIAEAIHDAHSFGWWIVLNDARQACVVAWIFQLGRRGVAGFHRAIAAIKASKWHEAAREMVDSKWHRQTPQRANRLARIMRNGHL